MDVDSKLVEQLEREPTRQVPVIICGAPSASLAEDLERAGIVVAGREHAATGMVYARIDQRGLEALRGRPDVASVSFDDIQHAL